MAETKPRNVRIVRWDELAEVAALDGTKPSVLINRGVDEQIREAWERVNRRKEMQE